MLPALQQPYGEALYYRASSRRHLQPEQDVPVVAVANLLVVSETMPEALAHDITRVLFEKQPELAAIHPQARELSLGRRQGRRFRSIPAPSATTASGASGRTRHRG